MKFPEVTLVQLRFKENDDGLRHPSLIECSAFLNPSLFIPGCVSNMPILPKH